MSFTPIETQEDLDKIISGRLQRQAEQHAEKIKALEDERDELKQTNASMQTNIDELNRQAEENGTKIEEQQKAINNYAAAAVKAGIAKEFNLPDELASRLQGEDEDSMRKDAEALQRIFKKTNVAPMGSTEGQQKKVDTSREANRKMLRELKGEE